MNKNLGPGIIADCNWMGLSVHPPTQRGHREKVSSMQLHIAIFVRTSPALMVLRRAIRLKRSASFSRLAAERGTQRLGNLRRLTVLQHHRGHRPFDRQLFIGVENLIVVPDRATAQLADREPQTERSVEGEHAEESALHMYAREIVILASDIHRPFDAPQQFALSLFDDLKDAREVQTPGGICVSPTQTAL